MDIIQIIGPENSGKTTLLNNLIISIECPEILEPNENSENDYCAYFRNASGSVCITTAGDKDFIMEFNINFVKKYKPILWICATKTKGGAFDVLNKFVSEEIGQGYEPHKVKVSPNKQYFGETELGELKEIVKKCGLNVSDKNYITDQDELNQILNSIIAICNGKLHMK